MPTVPVTAVIPVLNREVLLVEALESIRGQRAQPAEVIVVDDGSHDRSGAVAREFGATVLRHHTPQGEGAARNAAVAVASQSWLAFLDSDDLWMPGHLETCWAAAQQYDVVFVSDAAQRIGDRDEVFGHPDDEPRWFRRPSDAFTDGNVVMPSGVLCARDALLRAGGFPDRRLCGDLDTWIRLYAVGPGVALSSVGYGYRKHDGNISADLPELYAASVEVVTSYRGAEWWDESLLEELDATWQRGAGIPDTRATA